MHPDIASLPPAKRDAVMRESLREFAEHGYTGASTNRIVRRVGIAKGSLFHYFGTKERLFLALMDEAATQVSETVRAAAHDLPGDPVERIIALARAEFGFYTRSPQLYRLLHRAVSDPDTAGMIKARYADSGMSLFLESLAGATFAEGVDESTATAVLAWIVNGFNETFLPSAKASDDPDALLQRYESELRRHLAVVAPCVCSPIRTTNTGGST